MNIRSFAIWAASLSFLLITMVGLFNYIENPFSYFRANYEDTYDINAYWRLVKPKWYLQENYDAVFIGTSRSQSGFRPETYDSIVNRRAYNLAIPGLNYYEAYECVEFILDQKEAHDSMDIILGLDSYLMPFPFEKVDDKKLWWLPQCKTLFGGMQYNVNFYSSVLLSANAIRRSIHKLQGSKKGNKSKEEKISSLNKKITGFEKKIKKARKQIVNIDAELEKGMLGPTEDSIKSGLKQSKEKSISMWLENIETNLAKIKTLKEKGQSNSNYWQKNGFSRIGYERFKSKNISKNMEKWSDRKSLVFSDEKLKYFEMTLELVCQYPDVRLKMIHLPMHYYVQCFFDEYGEDYMDGFKTDMARAFIEKAKSCSQIELYDYLIHNNFNTEILTEVVISDNFRDLSHMRASYGDLILQEIYKNKVSATSQGYKLESLEDYMDFLAEDKEKRSAWCENKDSQESMDNGINRDFNKE